MVKRNASYNEEEEEETFEEMAVVATYTECA